MTDWTHPRGVLPGFAARLGWRVSLVLVVLTFLVPRLIYISRGELSGDEAVFGLMALEIGRGESHPLYCWGAHYAAALVSYIAVPFIALFGATPFALRTAVLPWGIVQVLVTALAFRRRIGALEGLLVALTVAAALPDVMTYSILANGCYAENFFLGPVAWFVALDLRDRPSRFRAGLLGFLSGLVVTICWLGLPMIAAAIVFLALQRVFDRRLAGACTVGALIGSAPFLVYNLWMAPGATLLRLGARALEAQHESMVVHAIGNRLAWTPLWLEETAQGLHVLFAPFGGVSVGTVLVLLAGWGAVRMVRSRRPEGLLVLAFFVFVCAFNYAGNLTRPRHWMMLWFVLPWGLIGLGRRFRLAVLGSLAFAGLLLVPSWVREVPRDPVPRLVAELATQEGADALIADYDIGYLAAFYMGGRVPIAAVIPPNPTDRRPDWTEAVRREAKRPAIVMPADTRAAEVLAAIQLAGYGPTAARVFYSRFVIVADLPGSLAISLVQEPLLESGAR